MVKIFVTGDNHIGRKFNNSSVKDKLIKSRFDCLEKMIARAEEENCAFFVITGDLFDNISVSQKDIKRVVEILGEFNQTVLVLPGNHDFYTGNEDLWKNFKEATLSYEDIILLDKDQTYEYESEDGPVVFYPAYCNSKHSETNRLDWIKEETIDTEDNFNIGIAHGALQGLAIDKEKNYFPMTRQELMDIKVDLWLLGHAHICEPSIEMDKEVEGYSIFNPGTHEQLDSSNRTEGNAFIITLQYLNGTKKVTSKRICTGNIRHYCVDMPLNDIGNNDLEEAMAKSLENYSDNSIVRIKLSGSINKDDFEGRGNIYQKYLSRFLDYRVDDEDLYEMITDELIDREFPEIGFEANFLKKFKNMPVERQMAYDLINSLKK